MGSQEDDHITTVCGEEVDEDDESEDEDHTLRNQNADEDDVDLVDDEEEDDSMSSGVGEVTIAVAGVPNAFTTTVAPTSSAAITSTVNVSPVSRSDVVLDQKKIMPIDESRKLFQRLWTDEDEIELLQGFLDYNNQRLVNNSFHHHHHDTTAFYDQIKDRLQLDFNKNQLVEKLRRLKKKYRTVLSKISFGKEYVFKSAHDQITFDISSKIWSTESVIVSTPVITADASRFEDEEPNNPNPNLNLTFNLNEQNGNCVVYPNSSEKKVPRSRKRSRSSGVKVEEKVIPQQAFQRPSQPVGVGGSDSLNSIPNLVEETVKSCLLPLFKELVDGSHGGLRGSGSGRMNLDPFALRFDGSMNFSFGDVTDEKWRKQHILELEVCSKRLELMQDQIKSQLEELRSNIYDPVFAAFELPNVCMVLNYIGCL